MKTILLIATLLIAFTSLKAQNFPHLNASTGNKGDFIIDADSNIIMFHGNRVEKLDKNFNPIWINSYMNLSFKSLLLSKTGSLFFIGSSAGADKIGKIEANGNLTWCKALPTYTATISGNTQTVSIESADQILLDRNAQLVITGVTPPLLTTPPLYLLKVDTTGNFIKLRLVFKNHLLDPKNSTIINDVSGVYQISSWGYGFEGPVFNLTYKYNDLTDVITVDSLFQIAFMGTTMQYPSSNEKIIKSKMESNVFYLCNNAGAFSSQLYNTFSFRKIKNTVLKWGIQFQTFAPYLMSLQNVEEDHLKNVYLSVTCKNVSTNKFEKWIVKVDSNGLSDNKKYNWLQNFGQSTFGIEDSITQLKHHYGNHFFYSIETSGSLPGPLSITEMDSTIGSYCSPTASISVTPSNYYTYVLGSPNSTTLTSVASVTMSSFPSTVSSVSNFSVLINSCLALSAKEINRENPMAVYPNPAANLLTVQLANDFSLISITIFDVNGKLIMTSGDQVKVDVTKLKAGIYFMTVMTDKGEYKQKFIKE
ncbi:MAG: T9SS type A sorting domain-containing protein [Bacteroidota bacterium]